MPAPRKLTHDGAVSRGQSPRRTAFVLAVGAVLAALLLALATGFDLDPFDSSELALAAVTAGLGHPPGQPVHTILGWLITRGPWRPLAALAWLSIVPTVAMFALATWRGARETATKANFALAVAMLTPCFFLPVLDSVCRVEVYALGAALAVAAVVVSAKQTRTTDLLGGVFAGLASATNPVLGIQAAGAAWTAVRTRDRWRWTALLRIIAGGLLGLTTYAYAWLARVREADTMVWSSPNNLRTFYGLLSGQDFLQNRSLTMATMGGNLVRMSVDLTRSGVLPFWCLGAWGLWRRQQTPVDPTLRREEHSPLFVPFLIALVAGLLLVAVNKPYRPANPDYGGYYLTAIALACAGVARLIVDKERGRLVLVITIVTAAIGVPGALGRGRSTGATRAIATELLMAAPERAIIVVGSDHLIFPALYLQRVEGLRRDVTLLNPGWGSSSWAWRWAMAHDPGLHVDMSPSVGRAGRMAGALRSREPGRVVLAESLSTLAASAPGPVCPRGVAWSSREGCTQFSRFVVRALNVLRTRSAPARSDSWDRRIAMSTARSMADQSLTLGCRGLALDYYDAGLGEPLANHRLEEPCDGIRIEPPPPMGLLEISTDNTRAARAMVRSR